MRLLITGTDCGFYVEQPTKILDFKGKKERAKIQTEYDSENYTLSTFYQKSNHVVVHLVNTYNSVADMEAGLHYLFSLACIAPGAKLFRFVNENGSGNATTVNGAIKGGVNVKYQRYGTKWLIRVDFKILETFSV